MKKQLPILSALLFAIMTYSQDGTLQVNASASLKVFTTASLTVKDGITNLGDGSNFIIQSDANLIQINTTNTNTGNLTSEREFKIGAARLQYNYVGTPVAFAAGQTYKTIFPGSTNTQVLFYNQTSNTFSTSSGANIPGRGLAVKEPPTTTLLTGGKTTAQFKGVPQTGDLIFGIANRDIDPNSTTYGYNLVGNPYPSNIDLIKLYTLNGSNTLNNISASFYLWDNNSNDIYVQQGSSYEGQAYAIYNALAGSVGTGTAAVGARNGTLVGTKTPTNILKVGQGFMTRSLKSTYSFKFDNTIRTAETTPVDFLGKQGSGAEDDRYWLRLTAPSGIISTMAVVHYSGGNNLFGAEDSRSMGGSDALFSRVENEKLAIEGRSTMVITDVIPLGSQHFVSGTSTIGIDAVEGIFANGQNIYLKDRQTSIITNLSEGHYTFGANAGESTGRFEIIYKPESILTTDSTVKESLQVYRDSNDFVVRNLGQNITEVALFDASGRLILTRNGSQKEWRLDAEKLTQGMFVLKVTLITGEIQTRKIRK
ncbi:hypothetical protein [Chryseobacterium sp. MP_3.2]|uniref:hypothetical protein n=1 Tax=Chryseobacterium sp. MP_3.2 TaxID=3071712 RepID=UPI002DF8E2A2|nr:hypothetical protein [Chryseobacterium sp. MP_3.2]